MARGEEWTGEDDDNFSRDSLTMITTFLEGRFGAHLNELAPRIETPLPVPEWLPTIRSREIHNLRFQLPSSLVSLALKIEIELCQCRPLTGPNLEAKIPFPVVA